VQERELELIDGFFELEGAWSFGCEPVDFPVEQRERVLFPFSFAEEDPHLKKSRVDEWRNRTTNGQRDLLVEAEQSMEPRAVAAELWPPNNTSFAMTSAGVSGSENEGARYPMRSFSVGVGTVS
jgi:hypothetical protein